MYQKLKDGTHVFSVVSVHKTWTPTQNEVRNKQKDMFPHLESCIHPTFELVFARCSRATQYVAANVPKTPGTAGPPKADGPKRHTCLPSLKCATLEAKVVDLRQHFFPRTCEIKLHASPTTFLKISRLLQSTCHLHSQPTFDFLLHLYILVDVATRHSHHIRVQLHEQRLSSFAIARYNHRFSSTCPAPQ